MMTKMMFGMSFGFAVLILATQHAFAAVNCAERSVVLNELSGKYQETRRNMGVTANNAMMEIFASAETGTWTLIITTSEGITCLVASGDGYETLTEGPPKPGEPA